MQLVYPEWLNGLWLVAGLFLFYGWTQRRKRQMLQYFGNWQTLKSLTESHSRQKEWAKKILLMVILTLLIIAVAQPQWGEVKKEVKRKGIEIVFLLDTSLSMRAEDVSPSRIERAKIIMKSFLRELKGDRVGIVTFAGSGFIQSPLTLDYDAFLLFANSIQVGYIPDPGTSLGEAIKTAIKAFPENKQKNHTMVLLSDGENLEGAVDFAIQAAQSANIRIYTVGLGTPDGAPIPLRSEQGEQVTGYKKDKQGQVVITKLNEQLLKDISEKTKGVYFLATPDGREVDWIYQHMQNIEKKELKQRVVVEREEHFQAFLGLAVFLLIIEMLLSETQKAKAHA
ncbi:MAG: hypothetical protein A3G33_07135 [Omnitrophica bacterium RIFCSPLOWO2_12_FULL_44_17]|uniref:VWFA domain-containing protein n=1 Tax=Candidatus Danuiimicrobium aquiferis TaxID=1801832 RepID=A0A1G1KYS6_9BACT|nr:MAG: hypothetical protein A3B72_07430 [Omnitrophica bacterium RIFCSPHIGHO2_02_FULL_45_28]OGW90380.1 MAG: hypothetical protein A3E74_07170 [Omnitrophica bacterium RIFCSPHIGHO2_12_FULL_44_12]OGW98002.1 MAG: hypothetical protein A3G33_07135 [Omnitrophica bacterium RIFCSPLOWO2_12_FULL_44_17]OGX03554.1 MAG: hypothetical protein A3J12_03095 [Omnitrophica bacterium RIFCSPLOWO2_02_FULL_44_11]